MELDETKWKNNVIQFPPPYTNADSYALDAQAMQYAKEGMPVTYEGKVIGKVTSVIDDSVEIEIAKEYAALVREKLNWSPPHVS